jgi:Flp pilus assembly protein TadD
MKRFSLVTLFLIPAFIFNPSLLHAQRGAPSGSRSAVDMEINIQVRNPDGTPGPRGIHVRLEAAEGGSADDCVTEQGGKCKFHPNSTGMYVVRINQLGYKEVSVVVNLVDSSREYVTLDLKSLPESTPTESSDSTFDDTVSAADLSVPENARREFERGKSALKENKLESGISHLRRAIKLHENFPLAYTLLGTAYLEQKNWKDAQTALERAAALDSKSAAAYLSLGAVFNQTNNYPQAETALLHGLDLNPNAPEGHYELAKTYWALGRWQEAAPHARKAVADMPDLAPPHVLLGNILLRERNAQGALHEYQEYLRLDPNGSMAEGVRQMIEKLQKAIEPN